MSATRRLLPAAVFVLLLATFLRFHLLGAQSFWNDEGNSARLSERAIPAIIEGTASDIHPPLYYLALRGWRELLGETEFGLRALSAFAGVVTVAVVMALGRKLTPRRKDAMTHGKSNYPFASSRPGVIALTSSAADGRKLTPRRKDAKTPENTKVFLAPSRPGVIALTSSTTNGRKLTQGRKGAKTPENTKVFLAPSRPGVIALTSSTTNGRKLTQGRKDAKTPENTKVFLAPSRPGVIALTSSPIAGLLAAISPVLVYYSQETRMYALLALLATLSAWALLAWLGGARPPLVWMAAYTLLLAAGLYTHYFFPAVIVAQGAVVLLATIGNRQIRNTKYEIPQGSDNSYFVSRISHLVGLRPLVAWVVMAAVATLLYAPWIPVFLRQIGGRGEAACLAEFAAESARWLALGSTVAPDEPAWAVVAFVALAALGVVAGGRRSAAPLLLALIPLALMFLVGATDPAFFKFMLAVVPFLAVLMGMSWTNVDRPPTTDHRPQTTDGTQWSVVRRLWSVLIAALTIAVIAGSLLSLGNLYTDPAYVRADYRGMAARIAAEGHPNAGILLVAPNQWEAFTYYHRSGAPVYPLPRGRPDPSLLEPELERIAAAHDRLYVLYWGEAQRDPERVIERWLDAHTFKASEEWVSDVRFAVYALPHDTPAEPTPSGATFAGLDGETITLHEYTVWPVSARPGDVIQARLVWSADRTPARPYKVFLHLLDASGNVVAQRDGEPGGGSRPTTGWSPGERVLDNHGLLLPPDLPPGKYALHLGLYDAFDPAVRLPVGDPDGLNLGQIRVTAP